MMYATEAELAVEFLWHVWKVPRVGSAELGLVLEGVVGILHNTSDIGCLCLLAHFACSCLICNKGICCLWHVCFLTFPKT